MQMQLTVNEAQIDFVKSIVTTFKKNGLIEDFRVEKKQDLIKEVKKRVDEYKEGKQKIKEFDESYLSELNNRIDSW